MFSRTPAVSANARRLSSFSRSAYRFTRIASLAGSGDSALVRFAQKLKSSRWSPNPTKPAGIPGGRYGSPPRKTDSAPQHHTAPPKNLPRGILPPAARANSKDNSQSPGRQTPPLAHWPPAAPDRSLILLRYARTTFPLDGGTEIQIGLFSIWVRNDLLIFLLVFLKPQDKDLAFVL